MAVGGICTTAGGWAGIAGAVYKFFNRFVSSDLDPGLGGKAEEGSAAMTIEGTAACVGAPDSLLLVVSASLSSDPEESPPMSKSSMRPAMMLRHVS